MNEKKKLKKWHLPFLIILILGTVIIARRENPRTIPFQAEEGVIFGTNFHVKYQYGHSLKKEIMQELNAVDMSLSMFNPQSTISSINSNKSVETDSLLNIIFTLSTSISQSTDGAFDATVAPLVNLWGFGFKKHQFPDSLQVDSVHSIIGWEKVSLTDNKITKEDPRITLDFSAIAKGFGADQVASLFRRHDIKNFMIEIGGEIVAQGQSPKQETWKIGINKPSDDSTSTNLQLQEILSLTDCAMATSGNYRNFYLHEGKKISHTINPRTGYPAHQNILSSTVIAPSCAMADGYATAFMVMGLEKAQQFLAAHPQMEAYFIYTDSLGTYRTWQTPQLVNFISE